MAKDFFPQPKVDSRVIKLLILPKEKRIKNEKEMIDLIKIGFLAPRKTLNNNLSSKFDKNIIKNAFQELNLSEKIRAHDLSIIMWINLAKILLDS